MTPNPRICVLSGGVGAARLLAGVTRRKLAPATTAVVNTGDDTWIAGVRVCPDLDTITYTLSGLVNPHTGWGIAPETFSALTMLRRLGGPTWFTLGDRDIGLHLYRTDRLRRGEGLRSITRDVVRRLGIDIDLVPMSDDEVATMLTVRTDDGVAEVGFQEYFVAMRHQPHVERIRYDGIATARPHPDARTAIAEADLVIIAPSNPFLSVFPILELGDLGDLVRDARDRTVAISPIVGGQAIKGPAASIMADFGLEPSATSVAQLYAPYAGTLVVDHRDGALAGDVERHGVRAVVMDTMIADPDRSADLVDRLVQVVGSDR
ncbi:2-phospho-L-lactate transferase [Acidimicrobium ferrooxidans]|uniref:2-phospho-L-lactate transferase n=1 Tax=Acidimicrobium ferrooxidans TaxID=53635 RepID=UPI0005A0405C|nr:2-phospho-L-lactate transferase [Acidimicrobium ferrooxidans]